MFRDKSNNKLRKFYLYTVKPKMLSVKHFFKSSIIFFNRHPRLKSCSIVATVFLLVVAVSAIMNTFSRSYLSSNIDNARYDEYTDEFWHALSKNNSSYSRPKETISYKDLSYGVDSCNIDANITYGHNLDLNECALQGTGTSTDPYQIDSINKFIYVRTLGSKAIGLFFIVTDNLDFNGVTLRPMDNGNNSNFFGGVIDGNFKHFKNISLDINGSGSIVTNGLIPGLYGNSTHAAIVKNFIIDDVSFSLRNSMGTGIRTIGAAVGFIGPYSYAYNNGLLSGTITSTGITADSDISKGAFIGSLYGYLTDFSISNNYKNNSTATTYVIENAINGVFNSYSYANFNISGNNSGNVKFGGVLGSRIRNADFMNADNSLLFNMNYYGKMTVSGNADYQFVYNGTKLISSTISPHNSYYWYKGDIHDITTDKQSWAIAQDSNYLQSEGFVANLNSYHNLFNFYFDAVWSSVPDVNNYLKNDIKNSEWYISRSDFGDMRPYFPIVRRYTTQLEHSSNDSGDSVQVTFNGGGHNGSSTRTIPITNQDEKIDDYTYYKIELPFATDVLTGNKKYYIDGQYTMTFNGWRLKKVVANGVEYNFQGYITGMNMDYTLRNEISSYTKNINEVFSEGGYYLVPDGVTALEFEAVWAYTVFLSDNDVQKTFEAITYSPTSYIYSNRDLSGNSGLDIDHPVGSLAAAYDVINSFPNNNDRYNNVIMLVGNYHESNATTNSSVLDATWASGSSHNNLPVTIRSVDWQDDKKPDYTMFVRNPARMQINGGLRLDFINLIGIPQVAGYSGGLGSFFLADGINFEVTETTVTDHITLFTQNADFVKLLGGYYDVYTGYNKAYNLENKYLVFGGKARAGDLVATSLFDTNYKNSDSGNSNSQNIKKIDENGRVINIIGGRANLVSYDVGPVLAYFGKVNTYIDGGYINNYYSLYMAEAQYKVNTIIRNAYINNCYGGGFADSSYTSEGVNFSIDNSRIGLLFGGPKYGEISGVLDLDVTNSIIDTVYGGGYGGTEYFTLPSSRFSNTNGNLDKSGYNEEFMNSGKATYIMFIQFIGDNKGFKTVNYKTKIYSLNGVTYTYVEDQLAYLSNSTVNGVTFNISDSKVNGDIYGGGNRGLTKNDIRFTLHNVEVMGNIYGAGYSDSQDTVQVNESKTKTAPTFINYAIDNEYYDSATTTYNWVEGGDIYNITIHEDNKTIDSINTGNSGTVTASDIFINVSGDSNGKYPMRVHGSIYGGGNMANVILEKNDTKGEIHLNINDGVTVDGSVYGGGNLHDITANTNVIIENYDENNKTTIKGGVYAAGNSAAVNGSATVTIAGNPKVDSVYGGGNNGSATESNVYIEGGDIANVYGGSNSSGTVDNSHVYIGKHSPALKDGGYVEKYDLCENRAFNIWFGYDGENTIIHIENLTNINFDTYTIKLYLTLETVQAIGSKELDGWGATNWRTYSGGVITVNQFDMWGNYAHHDLSSHDEITVSVVWKENDVKIKIPIVISSISFEGYSGKDKYEFDSCEFSKLSNNSGKYVTVQNITSIPTPTKLGNIKVGNVFGGNNVGGKTLNTNVLVLGQDPSWNGSPYTVEVENVFGGGNATVTGDHPNNRARVVVNGAHITGNVYGSSNGDKDDITSSIDATMYAMPYVLIANDAQIDGSVFGGGFAADAPVGKGAFDTSTNVYLDSGTINNNVYGGGYGDTVLGSTNVWAGLPSDIKNSVVSIFGINDSNSMFYQTPISSNGSNDEVYIKGTLFGGSETGAKDGSYDYKTESVHKGISVYVEDFPGTCTVTIDGSIFGSGNFSSSGGYSDVFIKNWGTANDPKKMSSIQRAKNLYINNSALMLSGASDVTNKFNKVKYSFNAIEDMKIGNASTIYTSAQANLLKKWYSYYGQSSYVDSRLRDNDANKSYEGTLSSVNVNQNNTITVDDDVKVVVDQINGTDNLNNAKSNRLYLLNNRGLNILTSEEIGEGFGNVYGMTFLGVYNVNGNTIERTYYDSSYDLSKRSASGLTDAEFSGYVLGGNRNENDQNMDYFTHGFYTNTFYDNDGTETAVIKTTVINPTPNNQAYYYWNIGVPSIIMEIDLTASKYIRSGMKSVSMYQFSGYNKVSFDIAGIDTSSLTTEADFINPAAVPNIAETNDDAIKTFGLSIETSESGWVNRGFTYLDSDFNNGNRTNKIEGTIKYDTSGAENIPKFIVNIENSRNIRDDVSLGTVVVTINAHAFTSDATTPINSVIKLYINLDTAYYKDDNYESSIAPGKHYKSFLTSKTNITTTSEFSTYFNMYAYDKDIYQKARIDYDTNDIDHILYTTYALPAGTRITMLDISTNDPKYYYYNVTGNEPLGPKQDTKYNQEIATFYSYPLSWFIAMDSTSGDNTFDESKNQERYVIQDGSVQSTIEQFIFMVDFGNVTDHTKPISQIKCEEFYLGLRASKDGNSYLFSYPMSETMKDMNYSIFNASDASFNITLENEPDEDSTIYVDDIFNFNANVAVHESSITDPELGNLVVRNTSYYQDRLGLRIGLYRITEDEQGNEKATLVTGDELAGATFYVDGVGYAPGSNGFVRLKLTDYVVNIIKEIKVDLSNAEHLTSGLYEFRVTAFASADGLYAKQGDSITNSTDTFRVNLVNENYGLLSTIDDDKDVIIYSDGKTSGGTDKVEVTLNYFGSYTNPNVKVSLMRRDYTSVNSYSYNDVNMADYFDLSSTTFSDTSQLDAVNLFDTSTMTISKNALINHINSSSMGNYKLSFKLKNTADLPTGTYRLVFTLYNGNKEIGDVYSYLIIKD